jgi:hypothetical protein
MNVAERTIEATDAAPADSDRRWCCKPPAQTGAAEGGRWNELPRKGVHICRKLAYDRPEAMRSKPSPEEQHAQAITRLVDETPESADPALSDLAARPEIQRQVAAQRRVARDLRTGGPAVPDRLVNSVEAKVRAAYGPRTAGSGSRWRPSGRLWQSAGAAVALAAVCAAIALVVVGSGGGSSGPSIPAAAGLAFAPSKGSAPGAQSPRLLNVSYAGVTYPNYAKFSVPPTGKRLDRIGGRPALTVFYRLADGTRLSYTVFSGKPVPLPANARSVVYEGVPLTEFSTPSGLSVVTLVRFGRTCVLAAHARPDVVLSLAAAPVLARASA